MKTNSQTPDNEVARLRQLLNRAIEIAEIVGWTRQTTYLEDMKQELHKMKEETEQMNQTLNINLGIALRRIFEIAEWLDSRAAVLEKSDRETLPKLRQELAALKARLAPAPEEPYEKDTSTKTCPSQKDTEWRELGPDEVIGASDEYNPASIGEWIKVPNGWIGEKCDITKIRTRRPLPKQEDERPREKEKVVDYCRKWASPPTYTATRSRGSRRPDDLRPDA